MSSERYWGRERPDMPVYGPTDPFGDEEHEPDVIVRVDFLMSREQLTTALGIVWAEIAGDRAPESLTVLEVRHEVEAWLSVQAFHELDKQMEQDRARTWSTEQQAVMRVLAEAVDRAYPATAPARRCLCAHPEDPSPCGGPIVVTIVDRENAGADGCEWHAARLLASLEGGRVYPLPDAPEGAAIRVFRAAGNLRPFPWLTDAPRTRPSQLSHAENRERQAPAVQEPRYGEGTVTLATLDQGTVTVAEPDWCRGHAGQLVGPLAEVTHEGAEVTAVAVSADLGEVDLLRANLTQAPFLQDRPEPHPVVYVEGCEAASFDAERLRALVANGRAYLDQLEGLAGQLDGLEGGAP